MEAFPNLISHLFRRVFNTIKLHYNENSHHTPHYLQWNAVSIHITTALNRSDLNKCGYFPLYYFSLLGCRTDSSSGATLPCGSVRTREHNTGNALPSHHLIYHITCILPHRASLLPVVKGQFLFFFFFYFLKVRPQKYTGKNKKKEAKKLSLTLIKDIQTLKICLSISPLHTIFK